MIIPQTTAKLPRRYFRSPVHLRSRRTRSRRPSTRVHLIWLLTLLLTITLTYHYHQRGLQVFTLPTDFSNLSPTWRDQLSLLKPERPLRTRTITCDSTTIDDRYELIRPLSAGREGSVSLYRDLRHNETVVIKTYASERLAGSDWLPEGLNIYFGERLGRWPTELPASLLFGGLHDGEEHRNPVDMVESKGMTDFVPVRDYFLTPADSSNDGGKMWQWNLVTPFFSHGSFHDLGKSISTSHHHDLPSNLTFDSTTALDTHFRPSFDAVSRMLASLHERGFCHNDIKARNIFLRSPTDWVLADLGAVREMGHPLYETWVWRQMRQDRVCVRNDRIRLMKTYLDFLRVAAGDGAGFDEKLYAGTSDDLGAAAEYAVRWFATESVVSDSYVLGPGGCFAICGVEGAGWRFAGFVAVLAVEGYAFLWVVGYGAGCCCELNTMADGPDHGQ